MLARADAAAHQDVREVKGHRLLRLRNPWGKGEWNGAWSDGSSEWTPEMRSMLAFTDANDGTFWINLEDFKKNFEVRAGARVLCGPRRVHCVCVFWGAA